MNPLRRKRLLIILAILVGVSVAVGLAMSALRENINLFYTPTQIANGDAPLDTRIRAGGMVEKGSLKRSGDSLDVTFVVTDFNKAVTITYRGILPDLFREGQGREACGQADQNQHRKKVFGKGCHVRGDFRRQQRHVIFTAKQRQGGGGKAWFAQLERAADQVDGKAFDLGLPRLPEHRCNRKTREKGDQAVGDFFEQSDGPFYQASRGSVHGDSFCSVCK